ncbi:uncharacterized protein LOC115302147 [Suricata suricatta]|uniref:uncharacterized protein LOC115302147 n=1 Tax=Suricata suricatta TaxID=37032 RepID=UPI00115537C5|nr:uncharacterized protein LOC115302147 [Suricata suricatta]
MHPDLDIKAWLTVALILTHITSMEYQVIRSDTDIRSVRQIGRAAAADARGGRHRPAALASLGGALRAERDSGTPCRQSCQQPGGRWYLAAAGLTPALVTDRGGGGGAAGPGRPHVGISNSSSFGLRSGPGDGHKEGGLCGAGVARPGRRGSLEERGGRRPRVRRAPDAGRSMRPAKGGSSGPSSSLCLCLPRALALPTPRTMQIPGLRSPPRSPRRLLGPR